jgi:hypothetical protein
MTDWVNFIHLQLALLDLPLVPEQSLYPSVDTAYDPTAITLRDKLGQLSEDGFEIEKAMLDIIKWERPAGERLLFPSMVDQNEKHPWKVRLSFSLIQSHGKREKRMTVRTVIKSGVMAKTKDEAMRLIYDLAARKMFHGTYSTDDWKPSGVSGLEVTGLF